MPYKYDPNFEEEEQQIASGGVPQQQATAGGIAGGAPTTSVNTSGTSGASRGTSSGQFQNLQSYLDANAGQGFGQRFANRVDQDIQGAGQATQGAANQFRQAADENTTRYNESVVQEALRDPTGVLGDEQKRAAFERQRDAQYEGPQNLTDLSGAYQQAQGAVSRAQDVGRAAGTSGGRFALLQDYFGRPQYSRGQKTLDDLLISRDPQAAQDLGQARANAQAQQANLNQTSQVLRNYAAAAAAQTEATRDQTRQALGIGETGERSGSGAIGDVQRQIDEQYNAARQRLVEAQQLQQRLGAAQRLSDLNPEDQAALNLIGYNIGSSPYDLGRGVNTYLPEGYQTDAGAFYLRPDQKLSDFYNVVNESDINLRTASDPALQTRLAALEQLANLDPYITAQGPAGAYDTERLYGFNTSALYDAAGANKAAYEQAVSDYWANRPFRGHVYVNGQLVDSGNLAPSGFVADPSMTDAQDVVALNALRAQYGLRPITPIGG